MNSVKSNGKDQSTSDAITSPATDAVNVTNAVKDSSQQPPCGPSPYKEGETVIARHGTEFYKAKIEKIKFREDWRHFIHYTGWKKRWDEWVGVDRLVKFTEENSRILSRDTKHVAHKFAKSGKKMDTQLDTCTPNQKKPINHSPVICRKRKRENFEVKEKEKDNAVPGKQFNMSIPPTLKKQLMADFEFINKMGKLVKLPRVPSVDNILDKYHHCRGKKEDVISASVGEVLSGVRVYFNKALPVMLLYNKERQQYQEAVADNVSPSGVYGAEHLLRLFVKLPNLLNNLSIDEETRRELQQNLHDILRFLQKNQSLFFQSTYYLPDTSGRTAIKDDPADV